MRKNLISKKIVLTCKLILLENAKPQQEKKMSRNSEEIK